MADLANINSSNFELIDNFGSPLTPVTDYSSFVLLSAFDNQNPEQNVLTAAGGTYFELVGTSSVNSYNVRVTSNFVNNIFYGSNEEVRIFTLTFQATLAPGGETIDYTETIILGNTNPEMYRNPNDPPTDIIPSFLDLGSLSNPISASTILLTTIYGRNGANTLDNPNTSNDLTWKIDSVVDSENNNVTGSTDFTLEIINDIAVTPWVETCKVKNSLVPPNSIPSKNYTLAISLSDAAGAVRNLILNVFYLTLPTDVIERNYAIGGNSYRFVEVQFDNLTSAGNGFYIYTGTWSDLTSGLIGNTIAINNPTQNADSCPFNASTVPSWYYGGSAVTSEAVARDKVVSCFPGSTIGLGGEIFIGDSSDFGWNINL